MKLIVKRICICLLVMVFLGGCTPNNTTDTFSQDEVLAFYEDFLDTAKDSWTNAVILYTHYEIQENLESSLESDFKVLEYKIVSVNQLSERLWEIVSYIESTQIPLGAYGAHYVGVVDGKLSVMLGINNIPEEVKEGVEIIPYVPHGPGMLGG